MIYDEIEAIIKAYPDECCFTGPASEEEIAEAEQILKTTFPESYKWFCRRYGTGAFGGLEILGVCRVEGGYRPAWKDDVVSYNLMARTHDFPNDLIIVECTHGRWPHALDMTKMKDGECPVTICTDIGTTGSVFMKEQQYATFAEFLLAELQGQVDFIREESGRKV